MIRRNRRKCPYSANVPIEVEILPAHIDVPKCHTLRAYKPIICGNNPALCGAGVGVIVFTLEKFLWLVRQYAHDAYGWHKGGHEDSPCRAVSLIWSLTLSKLQSSAYCLFFPWCRSVSGVVSMLRRLVFVMGPGKDLHIG